MKNYDEVKNHKVIPALDMHFILVAPASPELKSY
jgi:hypothetical protein